MITTTTLLLALSGALIAAGVAVIVRDMRGKHKPQSPLPLGPVSPSSDDLAGVGALSRGDRYDPFAPRKEAARTFGNLPPAMPPPASISLPVPDVRDAADAMQEAESLALFQSLEASLASALRAVNGAFAQVDARLGPGGQPTWDDDEGCHAMELPIARADILVGLLKLSRTREELEIASIATDRSGGELSRTRRLAPHQLNVQSIAESMAACAWPAVARHQDRARRP